MQEAAVRGGKAEGKRVDGKRAVQVKTTFCWAGCPAKPNVWFILSQASHKDRKFILMER